MPWCKMGENVRWFVNDNINSQLNATIIILLIISISWTCFGWFRPSSGALDCVYSFTAVYCSWRWAKLSPETCWADWNNNNNNYYYYSIGTTAHCELWPVEQCPSIFSYLPPTLSIYLLPALEDLFLLPLSILSWVFPFFSSLPILEWRSFWASYPPPFSLGDLTSLSFALLSILLYFLLCDWNY